MVDAVRTAFGIDDATTCQNEVKMLRRGGRSRRLQRGCGHVLCQLLESVELTLRHADLEVKMNATDDQHRAPPALTGAQCTALPMR